MTVRQVYQSQRNTETQIEGSITRGIEVPVDSQEPKKSKKGGKRPGAGRKPNPVKFLLKGTTRGTLLQAWERVPAELVAARITKFLQSKREMIWLQTLNFIYDRILGKPKQDVNVSQPKRFCLFP